MRVLVTWGSKMGGTAAIAHHIAGTLREHGVEVLAFPAHDAPPPDRFDAVVIGGGLYGNRLHPDARRYVERHVRALRRVPTWMFSSGPLDDTAAGDVLPPTREVRALMDRIGAVEHVTFGGRLAPEAKGVVAHAMAKEHAGDWRDPIRIHRWAEHIVAALPGAHPSAVAVPHGRSLARLVEYGIVGWALPFAVIVAVTFVAGGVAGLVAHAVVLPAWFAWIALRYHQALGARQPLPTAAAWLAIVVAADALVTAPAVRYHVQMMTSVGGYWIPLAITFLIAWGTGLAAAMTPFPRPAPAAHARI